MCDADYNVWHSAITLRFLGEEKKREFERVRSLLEEAAKQPDFSGFKVGVAEGNYESVLGVSRITLEAIKNERT